MTHASDRHAATYLHGVPSWVDLATPDVAAAQEFYGGLLGWTFETLTPAGVPPYVVARLDGRDAAAIAADDGPATWRTYVAVDDAAASADLAVELGGNLLDPPAEVGPAGTGARVGDPEGNDVLLWQAGTRLGAQVTNEPGAWNFTNLRVAHESAAHAFYGGLFGWRFADMGYATAATVPGWGAHLAATVYPDILEVQGSAPDGFEDVVGFVADGGPDDPLGWHVVLTVADHERSAARARALGAEVVATFATDWTAESVIRDPQGATLTLSQFAPPS